MQKKFIRSLALLLLLNLLIKPFWLLGIDRAVQNNVGAEAYGVYYALFSFTFILSIILDPGITQYNNRNIARHSVMLTKYFSGIIVIKLLLAGAYLIATFFAGIFLGYSAYYLYLMAFLALNQVLASFILYFRSNVSGLLLFTRDSILSVLDRALMIILAGILLWGNVTQQPFRIEWFVYLQTAAYAITAVVAVIAFSGKINYFRPRFNLKFFVLVLRQSFPFALLALLMALYTRADVVMLERMLPNGETQAGIYAASYRILEALNMIAYLFAVLLLPIFSKMVKENADVRQLVKSSFALLIVPALIAVAAGYFYAEDLMQWMYTGAPQHYGNVFRLLIITFPAYCIAYIFGTYHTAIGNMRQLNILAATGAAANIMLNFFLINAYGIYGAVAATLATQYFVALAQMLMGIKLLNLRLTVFTVLKWLVFLLILTASFLLLENITGTWQLNMLVLMLINFIFALLLRIINFKSIISSFKSDAA